MVSHVFCLMEKPQQQSSPVYPTLNVYDKKCIFIEGKCHKFLFYQVGDILPKWCIKRDNNSMHMEKFKFLYEAVNYFLPIFSHNLRYAFHYEYYSGEYIIHKTKREKVRQAFYYCEDENTGVTQFSNVFQCGNGLYISYKFICNGEFDCPDR